METFATEVATEATGAVIEVIEVIDYTSNLERIESLLSMNADASALISGFLLFFTVVALCYFVYKFFRIFF